MKRVCLCAALLWLLCMPALWAQPPEAAQAALGGVIAGQIDDSRPQQRFYIDGLRGEVIEFELAAVSGDLDPQLAVFDSSGALVLHQAGGAPIRQGITLRAGGRYDVVVARFGYGLGSTAGGFELRMRRAGVLSEQGSRLRYGDAVIGTISSSQPQVYYTFYAQQGEIVAISMLRSSGTLDPYLQVVDSARYLIAENDDQAGSDSRNARIDALVIEQTGTYIIVATRYGGAAGDSYGSFALMIDEAENSGTGSSRRAPLPMRYGESRRSALSSQQHARYYAFEAQADDLISITMARGESGRLDSYLILSDANGRTLIEDDDSGGGQDAKIVYFRIPAAGRYLITATRYEGQAGTSSGDYELRLEGFGTAFENLPPETIHIDYGSSRQGELDAQNTQDIYAFYAQQGDSLTISLTRSSGDLDPLLELLDSAQELLLSNDDGGSGQNALIDAYRAPYSGLYYIRARRYFGSSGDPDTAGGYALLLAQRTD